MAARFRRRDAGIGSAHLTEPGNPAEIEAVAVGTPSAGALAKLPSLRLILSLTAGTDAPLRDPDLPARRSNIYAAYSRERENPEP